MGIFEVHRRTLASTPELTLELTDDCNLRCLYCHASAGDSHKKRNMPITLIDETIKAFFSRLSELDKQEVVVGLGGGEPTYAKEGFRYALAVANDIASSNGIHCTFRMATNGCFGQEMLKLIINNPFEISLSFDGPAHIQDVHRPFANGNPSFPIVYETARVLYDARCPFAFRATVSRYSLPHLNEIVHFFASNFPGSYVGFEPLNPFGRGATDLRLGVPDRREFAESLLKVMIDNEGVPITFENAGVGKFELIRTVFCRAVALPSWTVSTDGNLSACSRDNAPDIFIFGKFDQQSKTFIVDQSRMESLRRSNVFHFKECNDCFCKYHCGGDCLDLRITGLQECKVNRLLGAHYLNKKIQAVGKEVISHGEKSISRYD